METVKHLQKKYGSVAMLIAIVLALALIMAGQKEMAKGLVLGAIFSVINFVLLGESLHLRLGDNRKSSALSFFFFMGLRFGLMTVPIVVAMYYDQYHIVTTIAGIFMVQVVMLAEAIKEQVIARRLINRVGNR